MHAIAGAGIKILQISESSFKKILLNDFVGQVDKQKDTLNYNFRYHTRVIITICQQAINMINILFKAHLFSWAIVLLFNI